MITTATEDGDSFILDGSKIFITNGPDRRRRSPSMPRQDTGEGAAGDHRVPGGNRHARIQRRRADSQSSGLNTCPFCQLEFRDGPRAQGEHRRQARRRLLHPRARDELGDPRHLHDDGGRDAVSGWSACIKWAKKRSGVRTRRSAPTSTSPARSSTMKIGLENSRKHLYDTARRFAKGRSVTTEISMAKLITSEANAAVRAVGRCRSSAGAATSTRVWPREEAPRLGRGADLLGHATRRSASVSPRCSACK